VASHNGLKYVLETKKGYVKKDGSFTSDKSQALVIDFWQFGFGPSALEVYKKLGFNNQEILDSGVSFHTIVSSYEGRSVSGLVFYELMGYSYEEAVNKSRQDYYQYNLLDDNNYLHYKKYLEDMLLSYYKRQEIAEILTVKDNSRILYQTNEKDTEIEEGTLKHYYSVNGRVYRYSIPLKNPHVEKYFDMSFDKEQYYNHFQQDGLIAFFIERFNEEKFSWGLNFNTNILNIEIVNDELVIYLDDWSNINGNKVAKSINSIIRDYYELREMHITRMFGCYILLQKINGKLKAVEATSVPIKYCPLMIKLLKEVGGSLSEKLIASITNSDTITQKDLMCKLINEVVIEAGYFDTSRPLNSCEANVLFGASETISSSFKNDMLDAAVIVSNNLGTIITTNDTNTQGAVKRMTGLFYTSPSRKIIKTAKEAKIVPVFPYTARINQLEGLKKAISLGYKKIAVTLAAQDNQLLREIKKLEQEGIEIYKFGLCSTGIDKLTATLMCDNADIVWACASKYVKELIEPNAIAQVGIKIPVHIMTEKGFVLVKNHLEQLTNEQLEDVELVKGDEKPVFINSKSGIKRLVKRNLRNCLDCPNPCV